ncbi:MAG: FecR domain-containing protein [Myxococcales bacterium]|nr:FecR domain-containing protein [Myxococcales bacterium]
MSCDLRDGYLDGTLSAADAQRFGEHAATCRDCSEAVAAWRSAAREIRAWAEPRPVEPSDDQVAKLLSRARTHVRDAAVPPPVWPRRVAFGAAVALAAALLLWALGVGRSPEGHTPRESPVAAGTPVAPPAAKVWAPVGDAEVVRAGADTFVVADGAELAALEEPDPAKPTDIRLRLRRGVAAFDVQRRTQGQAFTVDVREHVVSVVGTRFSVTARPGQPVAVHVVEGRVEVMGPGGPWSLQAGQSVIAEPGQQPTTAGDPADALLRLQRAVDRSEPVAAPVPEEPPPPSVERVREALLTSPEQAVQLARQRLAVHPEDPAARQVLAQGLEQLGDHEGAAAAWLAVAEVAQDDAAWAAQRSAARLLAALGAHGEAVEIYEAMLLSDRGGPLRAEAHLQLGDSLAALGRREEARAQWQRVVLDYASTRHARAALARLEP